MRVKKWEIFDCTGMVNGQSGKLVRKTTTKTYGSRYVSAYECYSISVLVRINRPNISCSKAGHRQSADKTRKSLKLSYAVVSNWGRLRLKRDGTLAETRFRLSAKRTSPFKSAGASVQSTTGSRGVGISGSNARYIKFWASEGTGYPLHSPVSASRLLLYVTVCRQVWTGLYHKMKTWGSEGFAMSGLSIK
jgi:hypothetical protein